MEISLSGSTATITGNIKSVSDYQKIKSTLDSFIANGNNVTLKIKDSISITSSVIGYFNKLILKDKVKFSLHVGNAQLMELLDELNLISVFHVQKV